MRFARGGIAAGSFRVTRILPTAPVPSSTSTPVSGRAVRWARAISSFRRTRRPAFRRADRAIRRCRWPRGGRCGSSIAAFDRLVDQVMTEEPYRSARRVFWVTDNGSAHRGAPGDARLQQRWPNLIPVHTPRHASWLNQIEIYFSIVQRKVLTPNEFASLAALEHSLLAFQARYQAIATPFRWTFTREDLHQLLARLAVAERERPAA